MTGSAIDQENAMSKTRPFNFKIHAAEFFSAVQKIPMRERAAFVTQFATDLITLEPSTEYGKHLIKQTIDLIDKQSEYGKMGGKPKHREPIGCLKGALENTIGKVKPEVEVEVEVEVEREKTTAKRFVIPSVEEITVYCKERGNDIDPQYFFDHYEARGWIPKGYTKQMKDWKAAVRTWEKGKAHGPSRDTGVAGRDDRGADYYNRGFLATAPDPDWLTGAVSPAQ